MTDGPPAERSGFDLPPHRADLIVRSRLIEVLAGRFGRRLTIIAAGAGFGKTSLLAQAMSSPLAQGRDLYHQVSRHDTSAEPTFAALIDRLGRADERATSVDVLVEHLWHESPTHVCLCIDDVHRVPDGAPFWTSLDELLDRLPLTAHLVISGRRTPDLALSRSLATGDAIIIGEDDLAFTEDELDAFALARAVDPRQLDRHGWPALVELGAFAGARHVRDFVAEEVLAHLPAQHVRALRRLAVGGVIDTGMINALTDLDLPPDELARSLPLTEATGTGYRLHDLWHDVLVREMPADELANLRTDLATELLRRGDIETAHAEAVRSGDPTTTTLVLRQLALDHQFEHPLALRRRVLAATPSDLDGTAEVAAIYADVEVATDPSRAVEPARRAVAAAREAGDAELEAMALLRRIELSFRSGDIDGIEAMRDELDQVVPIDDRSRRAIGVVTTLVDVWLLMLDNGGAKALAVLQATDLPDYPPLVPVVEQYRAIQLGWVGCCDAALREVDELPTRPGGRVSQRLRGAVSLWTWYLGRMSADGRADIETVVEQIERAGQTHLFVEGASTVALMHATAGDVDAARRLHRHTEHLTERLSPSTWGAIAHAQVSAVISLMDGDEGFAAATLDHILPDTGPFRGLVRPTFGNVGAMLYTLVPRSRPFLDAESTGPDLALPTAVGRALVALRDEGDTSRAAALDWSQVERLRTWAYEPHLAELAIGAIVGGNRRADAALATLRHDPRAAFKSIAERYDGTIAELAQQHLLSTPHRPSEPLRIGVLGQLQMYSGDTSLDGRPEFRRQKVRALIELLVHRRRVRRDEAKAVLWPDRDERSADASLRSTVRHLRALVEPDAPDGDAPPWFVRSEGDALVLFDSDLLVVDADVFSRHIEQARAAETRRRPAAALEAYREAVAVVRGPYLEAATDPDWAAADRMRFHLDLVDAAIRASELLAAVGDSATAQSYARIAVDAEPLAERGHRALARALVAHGDRAGARRVIDHAITLLEADGLRPEPDTIALAAELGRTTDAD